MPGVNAEFLALPLTTLADAALSRARELGAEYAALRVVSTRGQFLALQDLDLETSITSDDVGLAVRVVHDGCWGFAAGIVLVAGGGRTPRGTGRRGGPREPTGLHRARRARGRTRIPGPAVVVPLRDRPVRRAGRREGRDPPRPHRAAEGRGRGGPHPHQLPGGARERLLRRPRGHRHHPDPRPHRARAHRDGGRPLDRLVRDHAHARAPGGRRVGVRHQRRHRPRRARSARFPSCSPPRSRRRRFAPATTTSSSTGPTSSSPSTSRSGTPPSSTGSSATRRPTRAPRSRRSTSSAPSSTAPPS